MKKTILILLAIILLVPLATLLGVLLFIDPIVRVGVEKAGSSALHVPVRLNDAAVRLQGRATLSGFEIANPPGYAEPRSVAFERVDASVAPGSLLHDVVQVGDVTIVKPDLTLEFVGARSNWSALMDNLSPGKEPAKDNKAAEGGKRFIIHKLRIEEAHARFRSDLIPGGAKSVTLPSIELDNIGTAEGGATMGQILEAVLHQLGNAALKAGQGIVPSELLNDLGGTLKKSVQELQDAPKEELKKVKGLFERP